MRSRLPRRLDEPRFLAVWVLRQPARPPYRPLEHRLCSALSKTHRADYLLAGNAARITLDVRTTLITIPGLRAGSDPRRVGTPRPSGMSVMPIRRWSDRDIRTGLFPKTGLGPAHQAYRSHHRLPLLVARPVAHSLCLPLELLLQVQANYHPYGNRDIRQKDVHTLSTTTLELQHGWILVGNNTSGCTVGRTRTIPFSNSQCPSLGRCLVDGRCDSRTPPGFTSWTTILRRRLGMTLDFLLPWTRTFRSIREISGASLSTSGPNQPYASCLASATSRPAVLISSRTLMLRS